MPSIVSALAASVSSGVWRDERINDDRFFVDVAQGLALVADALGPTYGGYFAPFAIDPGIATLLDTFRGSAAPTRERLVTSIEAAHAVMRAMGERYRAVRGDRPGAEASRRAADAVRPRAWESYDSFAHFLGSLTACAVGPDGVVLAQIGDCHAYRLDPGPPELLARDHALPTVLEESAPGHVPVDDVRQNFSRLVVARLGGDSLPLRVVQVAHPLRIALVTDGVWRCEAGLAKLSQIGAQQELRDLVSECARDEHDDATAVVLEVR